MFWKALVLFTLVPVVELIVILEVGRQIGTANTIGLILLTGVVGAYLARSEGFGVLNRIKEDVENGRVPARGLVDGALILVGGLLLLTPGFITDFMGFLLLFRPSRDRIRGLIGRWLISMAGTQTVWVIRPRKRL